MASRTLSYDSERYSAICDSLGLIAGIHFVRVSIDRDGRERVGFTVGKPEEIRLLYERASRVGMLRSAGLIRALRRLNPRGSYSTGLA